MAHWITKRSVLLGGCAAVVVGFQNAPRLWDWWDDDFAFEPMASPEGYRRLTGSTVGDATLRTLFTGIGDPDPATTADDTAVRDNLCAALFNTGPGVPVAAFSDYYCPYCRILDARVYALVAEGLINVRHHETPVFGVPSEWAARGAIAARAQGQGAAYFDRVAGTPVVANPPFLRRIAEEIGLDVPRFVADISAPETDSRLRQAAALHRIFGFLGTPALVVGRTVLQGAITETNLRQLIDIEREHASEHPCA